MESLIDRGDRAREHHSGIVLIVVLIMLTAMTIAGVALVRVVDSANVISGNFAFRQATINIADLGIEAAVTTLEKINPADREAPFPSGCEKTSPSKCLYFPARSDDNMLDIKGLPREGNTGGNANNIKRIDWSGDDVNAALLDSMLRGYTIRYVIDRQCMVAPVTDVVKECSFKIKGDDSKKNGPSGIPPIPTIFYRVSIQVSGPRKTQSYVQVILGY
jgi:type IV pilus assembly protein PilX